MIRIKKTAQIPAPLATAGKQKRKTNCLNYNREPDAYHSGSKRFKFESSIYAHPAVKEALVQAQHHKCCFCERLIGKDGDVEHFRPKGSVRQSTQDPQQLPGYYWLGYEWKNLYLSCSPCNQRQKQNFFPLGNPEARATNHRHSLDREEPLFLDPGRDNPEDHIGFRGEMAFAINHSERGGISIDMLSLNRNALPEARLQRLSQLKVLHQVVQLAIHRPDDAQFQALARTAQLRLNQAAQEQSEFTSAIRWGIRTNFRFVLS
jgi:uncharacterized protein (TIGR02646 family)